MNISELRTKNKEELKDILTKLKKELKDTHLNFLQGKDKNIKKAGIIKRSIARTLTLINEKDILTLLSGIEETQTELVSTKVGHSVGPKDQKEGNRNKKPVVANKKSGKVSKKVVKKEKNV